MREHSAGGVVVRRTGEQLEVAVIQPQGRSAGHWVLPKGLIEPGELAVEGAVREVFEETGLRAAAVQQLPSSRYVYQRDGQRVFKVVDWWLMRSLGGTIGEIHESMRVEVEIARWLPLDGAPALLAYQGERATLRAAAKIVALADPDQSFEEG
jgi:8-oxo-dGTP pyrophosphatase MutT (NUDIX family)